MKDEVEFYFRVWVHPEGGDPAEVEVWYQGLEPTDASKGFASDWISESLYNEDFYALFDLDKTKNWQVVGKGTLKGVYDYFGEYDEDLNIVEFEKAEVPDWFYRNVLLKED